MTIEPVLSRNHRAACAPQALRILHVNHTMDLGGSEMMLLDLAAGQAEMGHEVAICSMGGPGLLDGRAKQYGIPVIHLHALGKLSQRVRRLAKFVRSHPQDILHSHWGVWLPTALAGFLTRTPCVHTHHANQRRRYFLQHRLACIFTRRVVVLTPQVDDYIKKWVGVSHKKIAVIPNGINPRRVQNAKRIELDGIPSTATVVGMIARLSPPKDYCTFLHAARLVVAKHPDVHFIAVGDGPLRQPLQEECARTKVPNFHFLGHRLDAVSILKRMSINVLATRNEGLSITLLEAAAAGLPCIATDIPSNRYLLSEGEAGILVPNGDPEALASAIESLLSEDTLRMQLECAVKWRSRYFTAERMTEDYLETYAQLLR